MFGIISIFENYSDVWYIKIIFKNIIFLNVFFKLTFVVQGWAKWLNWGNNSCAGGDSSGAAAKVTMAVMIVSIVKVSGSSEGGNHW